MSSLRARLFALLLAATGAVWISGIAWIHHATRQQIESVLDARLRDSASMVASLVGPIETGGGMVASRSPAVPTGAAASARRLSCQIWSLDGRIIARSSGAPDQPLGAAQAGFEDREIDGERWRVFVVDDAAAGVRVMVGDRYGLREQIVGDMVRGLALAGLLVMPVLGALIWVSVGRGLRPLRRLAADLAGRGPDDMREIALGRAPAEIRPLASALNGLFVKVRLARQHEREVTAFAAHELRTPLAGLRTQAQIALATTDPSTATGALRQILLSVDKTTRLVRQLLALAQLDASEGQGMQDSFDLGVLIEEVVRETACDRSAIVVDLDPRLRGCGVRGDPELVRLAIRNLHENAVQHLPGGGRVAWSLAASGEELLVVDTGPGIPEDELDKVGQRFFRGRHRTPIGSGLGLAIATLALGRTGLRLRLENRADRHGLRVRISPLRRIRSGAV
ncbi:sensor histidine kinase [Methylobacterium oryzisoli]|uniref:sensor histidine kinase n=1 Tax=Methylobacterium oryzisoli TaxID=3385502 RepID=UPI003891510A